MTKATIHQHNVNNQSAYKAYLRATTQCRDLLCCIVLLVRANPTCCTNRSVFCFSFLATLCFSLYIHQPESKACVLCALTTSLYGSPKAPVTSFRQCMFLFSTSMAIVYAALGWGWSLLSKVWLMCAVLWGISPVYWPPLTHAAAEQSRPDYLYTKHTQYYKKICFKKC